MALPVIAGILIGFGSLILGFILEGGTPGALLAGTAALIVLGGTVGATIVGYSLPEILNLPSILKVAFTEQRHNPLELIEEISRYAVLARREGFVGLEKELVKVKDKFLRTALQLVIDGTDPELTRNILEQHIYNTGERHRVGISFFEAAGGYAPTMGIIGTVMGLVHVLSNLSNPSELGPSIAMAFIATLYGVSTANLLWLPLASQLKNKSRKEQLNQEMILEGILALQAGKSPTAIRSALMSFLDPAKQEKLEGRSGGVKKTSPAAKQP